MGNQEQTIDMNSKQDESKTSSKNNALKKFQSRHPDQHQLFSTMFQSAKQTRNSSFSWQTQSEEINSDWTNMRKNEELIKFRKEDEIYETEKLSKPLSKTVTWSKNLLDIRTIRPNSAQSYQPKSTGFSNSNEKWKQLNTLDVNENRPELIKTHIICYRQLITNRSKLVNDKESYQSLLRIR